MLRPLFEKVMRAKPGEEFKESVIYQYIEYLHPRKEDWEDGDLGSRIEKYKQYKLKIIPLSKIDVVYHTSDDLVDKYKAKFKASKKYPPLVIDKDFDIIDGSHRAEALKASGEKLVKVLQGL